MRCCGCWTSTGYGRAKVVIMSCETFDHLAVAHRYAELSLKRVFNEKRIRLTPEQFEGLKVEIQELLGKQEMKIRKKPYEKTKPID